MPFYIILSRSKTFISGGASSGQVLTLGVNPKPQQVPDWVRDTNTFQLGVKDSSIVEIKFATPAIATEPEESLEMTEVKNTGLSPMVPPPLMPVQPAGPVPGAPSQDISGQVPPSQNNPNPKPSKK